MIEYLIYHSKYTDGDWILVKKVKCQGGRELKWVCAWISSECLSVRLFCTFVLKPHTQTFKVTTQTKVNDTYINL